MRFYVRDRLKAKIKEGETELQQGQIIDLEPGKATALIKKGKIEPLKEVMLRKYKQFIKWLGNHDLTAEEIEKESPELLKEIHRAIEVTDSFYNRGDYENFVNGIAKIKDLYLKGD